MKKVLKMGFAFAMAVAMMLCCFVPLGVSAAAQAGAIRNENGEQVAYYRTMSQAIDDINAKAWGRRAIPSANLQQANIRTVKSGGRYLIQLRKSFTENSVVTINTDKQVYIELGNYVLTSNGVALDIHQGNVYITAGKQGGIVSRHATKSRCVQIRAGQVRVYGGRYEAKSNGGSACNFQSAGVLVANNVNMVAVDNAGKARCVTTVSGAETTLNSCKMNAVASRGQAVVFGNAEGANATVVKTNIYGYAHYQSTNGTSYTYTSVGIDNRGVLKLRNSTVYGTHSGVQSSGALDVIGGSYSGYGHGGFYITGVNNVAYIKDAAVSCAPMPNPYVATIGCNNAAMYIGGQGAKNVDVYVDNCSFDASVQPIVLRSTSKETDCTLYISNSVMPNKKKIRVDVNHQVYLGIGNQFSATVASSIDRVVETNEQYR